MSDFTLCDSHLDGQCTTVRKIRYDFKNRQNLIHFCKVRILSDFTLYDSHFDEQRTAVCKIQYDNNLIYTGLSHMLLTLFRLTTKKNYKSNPLVMKPVAHYRNIKHVALFSQADTKLISSCQGHSYKSLLSL